MPRNRKLTPEDVTGASESVKGGNSKKVDRGGTGFSFGTAISNAASGIADYLGEATNKSAYRLAQERSEPGGAYTTPAPVTKSTYNPHNYSPFGDLQKQGANFANQGDDTTTRSIHGLETMDFRPPMVQSRDVNVDPHRADGGRGQIDDATKRFDDTRRYEASGVRNLLVNAATGNRSSVAPGMVRENAANADARFGQAANTAGQTYRDAAAEQAYLTREAGLQARDSIRRGTEDNLRAQASLAASARGNNIGLALRNAQNNAVLANIEGTREAGRVQGDANRQAAFQAGQAMSQASAQQSAANIEANRALETANARAEQIAAQEEIQALSQLSDFQLQQMGIDVDMVRAQTGAGQLDLNTDTFGRDVAVGNADRDVGVQTTNAANEVQMKQLEARVGTDIANMGIEMSQMGMQYMSQTVMKYLDMGMAYEDAMRQAFNEAANRGVNLTGQAVNAGITTRGQDTQIMGGGVGAVGAGMGSLFSFLSDERSKKNIKRTKPTDFRKAGSYEYEYKDPKTKGAAPGKHKGPMAQELSLELTQEGKDGLLRVDGNRLVLSMASAMGDAQRRLDKLEKKKKRKKVA